MSLIWLHLGIVKNVVIDVKTCRSIELMNKKERVKYAVELLVANLFYRPRAKRVELMKESHTISL